MMKNIMENIEKHIEENSIKGEEIEERAIILILEIYALFNNISQEIRTKEYEDANIHLTQAELKVQELHEICEGKYWEAFNITSVTNESGEDICLWGMARFICHQIVGIDEDDVYNIAKRADQLDYILKWECGRA